ncbi:MAG: 30S ribosomal protein S2 [SAR324 cluster bacterium]|nr:30S ribosomal protein S2 [SAR324 cluster bacterium]
MAVVSLKQFVEAGVHFGHQTQRWNPKMDKYIYGAKHGIHIIDLKQTLGKLKDAYEYSRKQAEVGKSILFVGTKDQARDILAEEACRCQSHFINERWLGGLLTNFTTVRQSVAKIKYYEDIAGPEGNYPGMIKKEALYLDRKRQKLERSLGGVKDMQELPGAIFIVDCKKEHIAIKEAQKLNIPIIAIVDTNCSPEGIDFPIPGNDDAPRAIQLFASVISTAVLEGKSARTQRFHLESSVEVEKKEALDTKEVANAQKTDPAEAETNVETPAKKDAEQEKTEVVASIEVESTNKE